MLIISLLEDCFEVQLLFPKTFPLLEGMGNNFGTVISVAAGLFEVAPSKELGAVLDQAVRFKSVTE
ncbi:Unannotated [Lentimonas sp. CC4]|nr:Unannotated [Lentimonas sp. CC4]CAA6686330.1 Unannotated [Lentimonas sp. CC6]CAA7076105.1 Unannotated [Lentimonas sp. CC4]CAA7170902.1 Unannotated [Lentimonas sp. CC21]CAA7181155.1 Unannotated [Lentimonas sp. CC8]